MFWLMVIPDSLNKPAILYYYLIDLNILYSIDMPTYAIILAEWIELTPLEFSVKPTTCFSDLIVSFDNKRENSKE